MKAHHKRNFKTMTYHKIKFFNNPPFVELFAMAKEYYIIRDVSANGFYSIILELSPNGKINSTLYGN
jgi:hypothetical protein